ncbi:MAG: radical SAM protein [Nitrososphaerota archaeon]|jgi:biotin synthase|uniref:radical SAM protein n=1 Tax=Candidatus Bathycorpusculum sp. TaxID=2994959 RepID=UPI002832228C|nr:radical SAM protein [Candidatus Termitimicrobium sp.]MCL2432467.1 radical SAM protein [Candidatus Termitimicrobium sp.]MDR0493353.1 radical SAM protein [Nitrososphaerota archaeon]
MDLAAQIRVSLGTSIVLGLTQGKLDVVSTTAYLMTYWEDKCRSNCSFCAQARESKSNNQRLARVTWPAYPTAEVLESLTTSVEQKIVHRVCIQTLNYPEVFSHIRALTKEIKRCTAVEVSVCCQPQSRELIQHLKKSGIDRLGIALDGATPQVFSKVKGGCYNWENQFSLFEEALLVFGKGKVSTHLIVGLGETERQTVETIQRCVDLGVLPALFAFTPVPGTALEKGLAPNLASYRRVQLARHLIVQKKTNVSGFSFSAEGRIIAFGLENPVLEEVISSGLPFQTSGCPGCNRPFYNEGPRGPIYNYPKVPSREEISKIRDDLAD